MPSVGHRRAQARRFEPLDDRTLLAALTDVPVLHSNPGADVSLYLDFNGHAPDDFFGYDWPEATVGNPCSRSFVNTDSDRGTPPLDRDGDESTFSQGELDSILEIWQRVAEDFSPFDIDVTTVNPGDCSDGVGVRVAIGGGPRDWLGENAGGIALIDAFTGQAPNIVYAFDEDWDGDPITQDSFIADTVSHEAGHAFGLKHQVDIDRDRDIVNEYSTNGGSLLKAPLMGDSQIAARSLWWSGMADDSDAWEFWDDDVERQDDMDVLARRANGFGYRVDDHGNGTDSATPLVLVGDQFAGSGIVEQMSDADYFTFRTYASGQVTLAVNVATVGPNLDARLELRDSQGNLIASATTIEQLSESLTVNLDPGLYYAVVRSQSEYGDVGQYTVSVVPPSAILFDSVAGVLTLNGEALGDAITIERQNANWRAMVNTATATFPADSVLGIIINAGAGSDTINVRHSSVGVPLTVNAGTGNDTINVGSAGNSLATILGRVTVHGDGGASDALNMNDHNSRAGRAYVIGRGVVGGSAISRGGSDILVYDTLESMVLNAGAAGDTVDVRSNSPSVTVNGRGGVDTLLAPDRHNTWSITGANAGNVTGNLSFLSVENLMGNRSTDWFAFSDGAGLSGIIDGRGGSDTLDYMLRTATVTVRLSTGTATGTGGVRSIENVLGGGGNDLLIGDSSANILRGRGGRDVVIGGWGADMLYGDDGQDLLISGATDHDTNDLALFAVLSEWSRGDQTYAQRIENLTDGGGLNGDYRLDWTTVHEDSVADTLRGGSALDWFFVSNEDSMPDLSGLEQYERYFLAPWDSPLEDVRPQLPL
jgi:Ca2+-binding RTX toxin-like protein